MSFMTESESGSAFDQSNKSVNSSSNNNQLYRGQAPIASMEGMEDVDLLSGGGVAGSTNGAHNNDVYPEKDSNDVTSGSVRGLCKVTINSDSFPPSGSGPTVNAVPILIPKEPALASGVKYRHIGKTGFKISNIGLGSMKLFSLENPDLAEEVVAKAFENGINFFEVSDPNQQDRSEREFGRIFARRGWRRRFFNVCTRVFWSKYENGTLSRKEIIESVRQSLRNLQLDYIDLLLVHKYDPNCPMEEIVRTMTYLVNSGLVMYWGTSRWSNMEIYEAHSIAKTYQCIGPVCELAEYHWFHREKVELHMAELFNRIGFGLMTWSPISFGLTLGGTQEEAQQLILKLCIKNMKYNKAADAPPINSEKTEPQLRVKQLMGVAEKLGCTLNQLCIAWCIKNQTSQCIIASAATVDQFMEILNCLTIVKSLTMSICDDIDKIIGNKPSRPPMISTLTQRWATPSGVAPC